MQVREAHQQSHEKDLRKDELTLIVAIRSTKLN